MARNRKHQSATIRFGPALKALGLCLVIAGTSIGYVRLKSRVHELGRQIKKCELRLAELRAQNEKLGRRLADLRTPAALEARIRELNLGLGPPQQSQILRLVEPLPGMQQALGERQFAAHDPPGGPPAHPYED